MKPLAAILPLLALPVLAFDSEAWFVKRAVLDREAERLQAAYTGCLARITAPAENLTLPIESHPDGSVKSSVAAGSAQFFLDTGLIWGTNVVVRQFATNGAVEAEVAADSCVIDRTTKSGWVSGHARASYRQNELEGDGIYFSFAEEFVKIFSNAVIRVKGREEKFKKKEAHAAIGGGFGSRDARIVSTRADYDRAAGVLLFEHDVRLSDPEYTLATDRLFVFLDGTNSLRRLVADGGVSITNELRSGSCARASYARAQGRVVMYGEDGAPAKLVEDGRRRNEVEGRKITFWLDSEQVEVEGAVLTVDGGMTGGKDGILGRMGK